MAGYCEAIKEDGTRCRARPLAGDKFCINHSPDPKAREAKASAVKKGAFMRNKADGLASWVERPITTMEDLKTALSELFNAGTKGDISTNRLNALASLANALGRVIDQSDIERRLEEIEARLAEGKQ